LVCFLTPISIALMRIWMFRIKRDFATGAFIMNPPVSPSNFASKS
jgi:hypothetical protein